MRKEKHKWCREEQGQSKKERVSKRESEREKLKENGRDKWLRGKKGK